MHVQDICKFYQLQLPEHLVIKTGCTKRGSIQHNTSGKRQQRQAVLVFHASVADIERAKGKYSSIAHVVARHNNKRVNSISINSLSELRYGSRVSPTCSYMQSSSTSE